MTLAFLSQFSRGALLPLFAFGKANVFIEISYFTICLYAVYKELSNRAGEPYKGMDAAEL